MWKDMKLCTILALVEIIMILPVHTAECKRGFFMMRMVKSDWRLCLQPSTLNNLLTRKLSGLTMTSFNPDRAISL